MKRTARLIFALILLLALAQPTFAACISCLNDGNCGRGDTTKCVPTMDGCISSGWCQIAVAAPLGGEYRIASVEITHGTGAKVQVAEKRSAKPEAARVAEARK
jgi:hypothetical protein